MATISVQVDEELKQQIEVLAKEDKSNASVIIRKAVYEYVSQKSPINKKSATRKAG